MGKRNLSDRVKKELCAKSGNRCAFPGCPNNLYSSEASVGEICHIEGLNPGAARYNPVLSEEEVNGIDNLILLCPLHHNMIDQNPEYYTVDLLKKMKRQHENNVQRQLDGRGNVIQKLCRIFQKYHFYEMLMEQSFDAPFPSCYIDWIECGCIEIKGLLESEEAFFLSGEMREELYGFVRNLEWMGDNIACGSRYKEKGPAVPEMTEEVQEVILQILDYIREIYRKYCFKM